MSMSPETAYTGSDPVLGSQATERNISAAHRKDPRAERSVPHPSVFRGRRARRPDPHLSLKIPILMKAS